MSQNSRRSSSVLTSLFGKRTLFPDHLSRGGGVHRVEPGLSDADFCCPQAPPSSGVGGRRELSQDEGKKKGFRSSLSSLAQFLRKTHHAGTVISLKPCLWHAAALKETEMLGTQSRPTLCDPIGCSLPGSSAHEIPRGRILKCFVIPFSRESSQPRDRALQVSGIAQSSPSEPVGKQTPRAPTSDR